MGRWEKFGGEVEVEVIGYKGLPPESTDTESKCGACANEDDDEERVVCCLFFFFK